MKGSLSRVRNILERPLPLSIVVVTVHLGRDLLPPNWTHVNSFGTRHLITLSCVR